MSRILCILIFAATVSACRDNTPVVFVSGEAVSFENRYETRHITLTTEQLRALSRWFEQRRGKWRAQITEASTEPHVLDLTLSRSDGETDFVDIVVSLRGGQYARFSIRRIGQAVPWAYQSALGILKSRYALQPINDDDLAFLRQLLSAQ